MAYVKEPYEEPSVLRTKSLSMAADVQDALRVTEVPLEDQEAKVTLPSSLELMKGDGKVSKFLSRQVCLKSYAYFGHITTDHSYKQ